MSVLCAGAAGKYSAVPSFADTPQAALGNLLCRSCKRGGENPEGSSRLSKRLGTHDLGRKVKTSRVIKVVFR